MLRDLFLHVRHQSQLPSSSHSSDLFLRLITTVIMRNRKINFTLHILLVRCLPFLIPVLIFSSCFLISFALASRYHTKTYTKIAFKLYFFKEKRFLIVFLVMVQSFSLFSQEGKNVMDTLLIQKDSVTNRYHSDKANENHPQMPLTKSYLFSSRLYKKVDIINKKVILVESAEVNYGEIEIKADSIAFNMKTNLLFAIGRKDTIGKNYR